MAVADAPQEVLDLLARYKREEAALQADTYGEADTRKEFVEPLFTALGWDVANVAKHAEPYKDVVNEYSLNIGGTHKAPDYAFRVGINRKFFVEAKRPGIDITKLKAPAYQLRRYGWTANLPVSVLVNFRHLAVYDCTVKPGEFDTPAAARTLLIPWSELSSRWSELDELLGKTSVYQGSLDRYAASATRRRGTSQIDDDFLLQMSEWRSNLARNIALRNKTLTVDELNDAVQQTIDRLIFLRIAEDRGLETYERLRDQLKGSGIYDRLMEVFRAADYRYNSGLFHFRKEKQVSGSPDLLTPSIKIDDRTLRTVIDAMYFPHPYEFSVLPINILGQIYEQFLGKVIHLQPNHTATIEDKPEVRKAGGVYYTPSNIVDHIVERTVGDALQGKTPRQALNLRILDPACGSGSFLIGAFEYLLRWFTEHYTKAVGTERSRTMYRDQSDVWRLKLDERRRILTSCIYGVDIDRQAVEVTKLSLMLKVLEGESSETVEAALLHVERVLPDLNLNIRCGNSLVGSDVSAHLTLTADEEDALNPFDWSREFQTIMTAGGFHVVLGNPPYDVLEKQRGEASWPHEKLREYLPFDPTYSAAMGGKLNLYRLFLVRAINLVRPDGMFGMIIPMSLAADISTTSTRKFVLASLKGTRLDCFPQKDNPSRRIFKRAKLSTMIVTGARSKKPLGPTNVIATRVFPGNDLSDSPIENSIQVGDCDLLDPATSPVPLTDKSEWALCRRIHAHAHVLPLSQLTDSYAVSRGEINQTTYGGYITNSQGNNERLLKGVELGAFEQRASLSQGEREWIDAARLRKDHPRREDPPDVRIATQRITGVDERQRLVASLITDAMWFADSTNSIRGVEDGTLALSYLLALLNSDLMQWRFRLTSTNNNVGTNELLSLPIRVPRVGDIADETLCKKMCADGQRIGEIKAQLATARSSAVADRLTRRLAVAWLRLNGAVYALYGLDKDDQALILGRLTKPAMAAAV
jgi:hypothetical protein